MHWFWKSSAGQMDLEQIRGAGKRTPGQADDSSLALLHRDSQLAKNSKKIKSRGTSGMTAEAAKEAAVVQTYRQLSDNSQTLGPAPSAAASSPLAGEQASNSGNEIASGEGRRGENNRRDCSSRDKTTPKETTSDRLLDAPPPGKASSSPRGQDSNRDQSGSRELAAFSGKTLHDGGEEAQMLIPSEEWTDGGIGPINPTNGRRSNATRQPPLPSSVPIDRKETRRKLTPDHVTRGVNDPNKTTLRSSELSNNELGRLITSHREREREKRHLGEDGTAILEAGSGQPAYDLDTKAYSAKKNIAQGLVDVALMTSNATQLKYLLSIGPPVLRPRPPLASLNNTFANSSSTAGPALEIPTESPSSLHLLISSNDWPIYMYRMTLYGILVSILLQVVLGISLLFNSRHDLSDRQGGKRAERHNNLNLLLIFLILLLNVFIDVLFMDYE